MKTILMMALLFVCPAHALESKLLKEANVTVRPVIADGKRLLVPINQKEKQPSPAFLLGDDLKPLPLKAIGKEPIKADIHAGEEPYWAYEAPKQESLRTSAFLVLVGAKAAQIASFYSLYRASGSISIPDCLVPPKGFANKSVDVHEFKLPSGERKVAYAVSQILDSAYAKLPQDQQGAAAVVSGKRLALVDSKGACVTLAEEADDGDGMATRNGATPMGPVLGLLALESGGKSETWLAVKGQGYETWGTTLIKIPAQAGEKIEREFLFEYGH